MRRRETAALDEKRRSCLSLVPSVEADGHKRRQASTPYDCEPEANCLVKEAPDDYGGEKANISRYEQPEEP
jgi:hypothetical protein